MPASVAFWRAKYESLVFQIGIEGCMVAHLGEYTYECSASDPCGLCRMRSERDDFRKRLKMPIDGQEP
jgi:hypothetical protein